MSKKIKYGVIALIILIALLTVILIIINNSKKPEKIEIIQEPDKMVYLVGESADYTGLIVKLTLKNGKSRILSTDEYRISGFNSESKMENCIITVKYGDLIDLFAIKVEEEVKPEVFLKSISLSPLPKTSYKVGEWLDVTGSYVVREYTDGSIVKVNLLKTDVYGWVEAYNSGSGTYTLTVKYVEKGILAETTYTITIEE